VTAYTGTASAVAREVAWLQTANDDLPYLLAADSGPWQNIQAYWPRTPATQQTSIYVLRSSWSDDRASNARIRPTYEFTLKLVWPIRRAVAPLAEGEQQALDNAIDLLIQRIRGPMFDKTHGGAFLSVGENPRSPGVRVTLEDPEVTIDAQKALRVSIVYYADDYEVQD
jgi:hypothetical protein